MQEMLKAFKEQYPNTIIIIDCTELKIQCPSSLVVQSQSYSNNKSTNTLKSLIGVDSKGGFMFVSQLYTGSISDKQIVKRSGFLDLLPTGKLMKTKSISVTASWLTKDLILKMTLKTLGFDLTSLPF